VAIDEHHKDSFNQTLEAVHPVFAAISWFTDGNLKHLGSIDGVGESSDTRIHWSWNWVLRTLLAFLSTILWQILVLVLLFFGFSDIRNPQLFFILISFIPKNGFLVLNSISISSSHIFTSLRMHSFCSHLSTNGFRHRKSLEKQEQPYL